MDSTSTIQHAPDLTSDNIRVFEESSKRLESQFYHDLCNQADDRYKALEDAANRIEGLQPGERFYVRHVGKNFDGDEMNRWVWFARRPQTRRHPERFVSCIVCESPSVLVPGTTSPEEPNAVHVEALSFVVLDWREGVWAAVRRAKERNAALEARAKKAVATAGEDRLHEAWSYYSKTIDLVSCAEGSGPNGGSKYFGSLMGVHGR